MTEPLVLINLFTLPPQAVDVFVAGWPASTATLARAAGFRGTRLHRAVSPDSPHQIVNVARWDSAEAWQAALFGFQPGGERRRQAETGSFGTQPALYRIISELPDPLAVQASAGEPLVSIQVFNLSDDAIGAYVESWPATVQTRAPGFRGTRLHRAVLPDSPLQLVNIAGWNSAEEGQAAVAGQEHRGEQHPSALYQVVSVTPDPLAVLAAR